jgi:hypothetical protein
MPPAGRRRLKCPMVVKNVESCYESLPWKEESQVNSPILTLTRFGEMS